MVQGHLLRQELGAQRRCRGCAAPHLEVLVAAGSAERMAGLLARMLGRFAQVADRRHLSPEERVFRIHWSGDFFSVAYAQAWAVPCWSTCFVTRWAVS